MRQKIKQLKSTVTIIMISTILMFTSTVIAAHISYQPVFAEGIDFKKIKNLSNNSADSQNPVIVVVRSGKNVYVVWEDESKGKFDIFFKRSTDGGKTFDKTINLSNNDGSADGPQIDASKRKNVFVVWQDRIPGNFDIFLRQGT